MGMCMYQGQHKMAPANFQKPIQVFGPSTYCSGCLAGFGLLSKLISRLNHSVLTVLFYFHSFIAFCIRMLLSALDHNMHTFRPQATTKDGKLIWKKQYSKRTKRWHPEPVKAEKSFEYIPYLMATILKARLDDKATAERVLSLPEEHPRHLAPTIALRESPELIDLVQEYRSRFKSKKV